MATIDDKNACEMIEVVKDSSKLNNVDTTNEEEFQRHSKSLVRKLDLTLMPTVSRYLRRYTSVVANDF
jgi:hypothetical protein